MADVVNKNAEKKEVLGHEAPREKRAETPADIRVSREKVGSTLAEGMTVEEMESSERVSEVASEGAAEDKGSGAQTKKDQGGAGDQGTVTSFVFDEQNLPPVDEMISRIEKYLRAEIRALEKQARIYQGGLFRKPDYPKYSETIVEIRKKNVLLKRLFSMAADALKKLFLQMFGSSTRK